MELSALKLGSRVMMLTAGRDVCGDISGDRWTMVSPDGTSIDVVLSHLVALRDLIGKQIYPREAKQIGPARASCQ